MTHAQAIEVLLRPAVELYTVVVCTLAAGVCLTAPWTLALSPELGLGAATGFVVFGTIRFRQALTVLRYRRKSVACRATSWSAATFRSASSGCSLVAGSAGISGTPTGSCRPIGRSIAAMSNRSGLIAPRAAWKNAWSSHRCHCAICRASPPGITPSIRCDRCHRSVDYRGCMVSSPTRSTSRSRWVNASVTRSSSVPHASARHDSPNSSSPRTSVDGARAITRL